MLSVETGSFLSRRDPPAPEGYARPVDFGIQMASFLWG